MRLLGILLVPMFLIGGTAGGMFSFLDPPILFGSIPASTAQRRVLFDLDPEDIMTKWGPFGYFNQYFDPSNSIGPEILRGFGSPFTPYNGFQLMESITTPPLKIPEDATTTKSPYPADLFDEPKPKGKEKKKEPPPTTTLPPPPPSPEPEVTEHPLSSYTGRPQPGTFFPGQAPYVLPPPVPQSFEAAYGGYPPIRYSPAQPYRGSPYGNSYYVGQVQRSGYPPNVPQQYYQSY